MLDVRDQGVRVVRHVHAEESGPGSYWIRHGVPRAELSTEMDVCDVSDRLTFQWAAELLE